MNIEQVYEAHAHDNEELGRDIVTIQCASIITLGLILNVPDSELFLKMWNEAWLTW